MGGACKASLLRLLPCSVSHAGPAFLPPPLSSLPPALSPVDESRCPGPPDPQGVQSLGIPQARDKSAKRAEARQGTLAWLHGSLMAEERSALLKCKSTIDMACDRVEADARGTGISPPPVIFMLSGNVPS